MSAELRDQLQQTLGGSYTLEQELGGAGMSRVFAATETRLHRRVVIKVLSPELAAGVSGERFEREIQLAASLQQANIVPLLSAGETNGLPYFTMPYVEGESLRARLAKGPLSIAEAVGILRDVARALSYAHERGVVHRDIKPDNILLSHGAAVVTDFGIAKAISASRIGGGEGAALTQTGMAIGTPAYMAPEQAAGDLGADHRVDIYAFGCTAYELLASQPPFAGRTPAKTLAAHLSEAAPPVATLRPDTPPALAELVMRCLAKSPEERPQSATQLIRALEGPAMTSGAATAVVAAEGRGRLTRRALLWYFVGFAAVVLITRLAVSAIGLPRWVFPGAIIVTAFALPVFLLTGWQQALRVSSVALGSFALVVVAFMVLRALGIGPAGSLLAAGKLHEREQFILTDFTVSNADSSLGRVASDAVRQALLESSVLTLVPPAGIAETIERAQRPVDSRLDLTLAQDIALRRGVRAIIDGKVTGVAGGYVVTLKLVSADSLAPIASVTATGTGPQGFIEAVDEVTRALRSRAGESLRRVQHTASLAEVTTGSLEALRKYSEAFRANGTEGNAAKAVGLAREAVQLDSTFAMAWRLIGVASLNIGAPRAVSDSALERAYRLRGKLSERERRFVEATYWRAGPHRNRQSSIAGWEALMAMGNAFDTSAAANYLAIDYSNRREYSKADSFYVLAIRTDSTQAFPYTNRIGNLVNAGRLADARAATALAERHSPNAQQVIRAATELLYHEGRLDKLRQRVDSIAASGDPRLNDWARNWKRALALRDGRLGDWERLGGTGSGENLNQAIGLVGIALLRGTLPAAGEHLEQFLTRNPLSAMPLAERPYLGLAEAFAAAGRPERARAILAEYGKAVTDTAQRRLEEPSCHEALGQVLSAEHRYPEAVAELRRSDRLPDGPASGCQVCLPEELGRVFDAAGQADSAIAMYEQALKLPQWGRASLDPIYNPLIHERLGALYEAKGDKVNAAAHYRALVELWKNADAELQPRVEAARAALRRLTDTEKSANP